VTTFLFRFLDWARGTLWLMVLVMLTCLAVGGWGFYAYYGPQFEWIGASNWFVYPFVPDCPLFVYLFVAAMGLIYLGRANPTFIAFVALGNIKYGIWTIFVLFYYYERFFGGGGSEAVFRSLILSLHIGMVPLGILLWRTLGRMRAHQVGIVLGLMLVYDYFDYFFTDAYQVYPVGLPNNGVHNPYSWQELGLVPWFTIAQSLVLCALLYWWNVRKAPTRAAGVAQAAPSQPGGLAPTP
jgi:uncharacterized membrane protein YpjA